MKRTTLSLLLLIMPATLGAQVVRDSILTVNVMRSVSLKADRAHFYVVIEGTAETAREAVSRADAKVGAVVAALRGAGSGVTTGEPVPGPIGSSTPRGFQPAPVTPSITARVFIRVAVNRLAALQGATAAALDAGAASATVVMYEASAEDSARISLRTQAVTAARTEAERTAAALGGRLGALVDVSVNLNDRQRFVPSMIAFESSFNQQSPSPDVQVDVNVTIRHRLLR